MRRRILAVAVAIAACTPVLILRGQDTAEMPHGDLTIDCGECHDPEKWIPVVKPPTFRHETTGFPLELAHQRVSCRSCHRTLVFARVGTACADCHRDSHRGELGTRCETCHTPTTWSNQRDVFRSHTRSRFPLFVAHARLDCTACHRNQLPYQYANTPAECGACHLETWQQTTNPPHAASGFSRRCEDCHRVSSPTWQGANFSHPASFPLIGGHAGRVCASCHKSGTYKGLSSACVSCHQEDYAAASNPSHVASGFPTTCESCHTIQAWRPAKFDHSKTGFALTGVHARTECARCHPGGRYAGTPKDCYSCHRADYEGTTNPNHVAAHFPTQCQSCHGTDAWRPAKFDHNRTGFPLTGAHTRVDCARCHTGGRYAGTPTSCYACHQSDYAGTTNPNHASSGFPTTCTVCHNTSAWRPASFNHNNTRFPLTGAHTRVDCTRCHVGGRYTGTPTDCYACHQSDYAGTTNPNHQAAGFPTQCQSCHNSNAWRPASFDHDGRYFPIYSGQHRGRWSSCGDCHKNAGNYKAFECIFCHPHSNRAETDSHHRDEPGYSYRSSACYGCHPTGRADFMLRGQRRMR
jgi:hypothetical protein